jgi:hypothetical protein
MLFGRNTYELMEGAWPAVARKEKAPRAMREWAQKLEAKAKYVVSGLRDEALIALHQRRDGVRVEPVSHSRLGALERRAAFTACVSSSTLAANPELPSARRSKNPGDQSEPSRTSRSNARTTS